MSAAIRFLTFLGIILLSFSKLEAFPIEAALLQGPVPSLLVGDHHQATDFDRSYLGFFIKQCENLQHKNIRFMIEHNNEDSDYYKNINPEKLQTADLLNLMRYFVEEKNNTFGNIEFRPSDSRGIYIDAPYVLGQALKGRTKVPDIFDTITMKDTFGEVRRLCSTFLELETLWQISPKIRDCIIELLTLIMENQDYCEIEWTNLMNEIAITSQNAFTQEELYNLSIKGFFDIISSSGQLSTNHRSKILKTLFAYDILVTRLIADVGFALDMGLSIQMKMPFIIFAGSAHVDIAKKILECSGFSTTKSLGHSACANVDRVNLGTDELDELFRSFEAFLETPNNLPPVNPSNESNCPGLSDFIKHQNDFFLR